jgi:hypothetical protein
MGSGFTMTTGTPMANATSKIANLPSQRQQMETRLAEPMAELFLLAETEARDFGFNRAIRRHDREVHAFLGEIVVTGEGVQSAAKRSGGRTA